MDLKANQFLVWDNLNCTEEDAENGDGGKVITAIDEGSAALQYAENDQDGYTDGLYHECEQPIMVKDAIGRKYRFEIMAEMRPHFRVVKYGAVS